MKYIKNCAFCNKEFSCAGPAKFMARKYCSKLCSANSQSNVIIEDKSILIQKCLECQCDFTVRRNQISVSKYCSVKCVHDSQKVKKISIKCKQCGKFFEKVPSLADAKYCCLQCKYDASLIISDRLVKQCSKCKQIRPAEEFYTNYWCLECNKAKQKKHAKTTRGRFVYSKSLAKRRKLSWLLSEEEYGKLINNECFYCLIKTDETGVGLDRLNNNIGYSIDNVVPCCGPCNTTRSDNYTFEEMQILAETIRIIKNKRNLTFKGDKMEEITNQKPLRTYVAIVLDKSGSMQSRKAVTVSGFNEHIQTLIANGHKSGETFASLVLFDGDVSADFFNVPVFSLREMTEDAYVPNGGTAMRDAIGYTLDRFSSETDITDPNNAYLVIIISDGEENASKHWSASRLKERMDELQATNRWTFVYMGCNQDVLAVEKEYNLSPQNVYKGWIGDDATSLQMMASGSASLEDYMDERSKGKTSKADYFK